MHAGAPQAIDDTQHMGIVRSHICKDSKRQFIVGMRGLAMHNMLIATWARSDEVRSKKICQQIPFNYPWPTDDRGYTGSKQSLQTTIYSLSAGKCMDGDGKDYQTAARHTNVSISFAAILGNVFVEMYCWLKRMLQAIRLSMVQVFRCPLSSMAMQNFTKTHLAKIPLPNVLGGKKEYYDDFIFAVGRADVPVHATHQYDQTKRAHAAAGLRKTGQVCHLPRHVSANTARIMYSEASGEVAIAGGWQKNAQNAVYCQLSSGDSVAHRAGYTEGRADVANFRQIISPMDFAELVPVVEALAPGVPAMLEELRAVS